MLTAAAARVAGPPVADLVRRRLVEPGRNVEMFLAGAPELGAALRHALLALEFGAPPLLGKLRPFTALDERSRDAVLTELRDSRIELKRRIFRGVKSAALLGVYAGAASYPAIGYPGPDGLPGVSIADAMRAIGDD